MKSKEQIVELALSELHTFKGHPFKVRAMQETSNSVKNYGVLVPAIVRNMDDDAAIIITLVEFINVMEVREDDDEFKNRATRIAA